MNGYSGQILIVNLTTKKIETKPLDIDLARKYIGGIGLSMRLVYEYAPTGIDPLTPENPLI